MKQRLLFLTLAFFCGICGLRAQTKVQLSVPEVLVPSGQGIVCAPVIADSFPNIVAMQFSLKWDGTKLDYIESRFGPNPLNLGALDTTTSLGENQLGISYTTSDLAGITVESGTVLMEVCFNPIGDSGFSSITWDGFYMAEFAVEGSIDPYPFQLNPGSISFGSDAAVSVLPGDTNDDGQVDHRDLLNIGLLLGSNGPARTDASTDFSQQSTTPWPVTLLNGINLAKVDANGDGEIGVSDADVVADSYDRAEGNFTAAPDISIASGPALRLEEDDDINAGAETTVDVFLGENDDPNAVGYGLAFTMAYDPTEVEESSIRVSYDDAFLGDDLLTIDRVNNSTTGRLEISLTRKDQTNATSPGGKVCSISFVAIDPNNGAGVLNLGLDLIPNAFVRADQSNAAISGGSKLLQVQTALAVREPAWGADLSVYPNPYVRGPLNVTGDLPAYDEVRVSDLSGRGLKSWSGNARQLDLATLPAGTYLLRVEIDGERVTRKLIKR